ncbi:hypothetical protein [Sphaerospermopsis sp. FACHB-1194]|uniref:hypothetical protein n=1 Tax=Sphaerospermopsis sp. FACHB-1194 TaxID=2692862 RepID=UPI0016808539|nr:hypothetical protein [Sphaerospermopsis sp. FACHB-1194]MBD2144515.1 hypothetical protein [Sphaerospermopsis sp. FACHB-1194]
MTTRKFANIISANWMQFLSINLLGCLLLSTSAGIKPASAVDNSVPATVSNELETQLETVSSQNFSQESQDTKSQDTKSQDTVIENNQPLKFSPAPETISQLDFSTSLGDTFQPANQNSSVKKSSLQPKPPQTIAQVDPSAGTTVGDTFSEANRLRQELLIDPIIQIQPPLKAAPGSSAGTPTAYGAGWGQAFIGGGLFFPFDGKVDGSMSVGFGLGNAVKSAGLEVAFNIISLGGQNNFFGDFADSGTVGLKLHRILSRDTAVAVGWSNAIKWGEADIPQETIYGVVSQRFDELSVSLGVGSGSFRSKGARNAGENDPNLFASIGYRVTPQASLVSSWTGSGLNLGASFVPFKQSPMVINAIFTDVTDNLNSSGFTLSAGYSLQF